MNDFDYDVMQKKRIARGAFARKGIVNRRGCVLPHENLTKKELNRLNGEVKTVSMTRPIAWEQFKALPADLQEEYVNTQIRRFGVGANTISAELFGLDASTLSAHAIRKGLSLISPPSTRIPKAAKESWQRWLGSGTITAPEDDDSVTENTLSGAARQLPQSGSQDGGKEPEVKPFRAHDFEDMFREMGMERVAEENGPSGTPGNGPSGTPAPTGEEDWDLYPLTDMSLTLKGTPVDVLATLRMSFPALLDKDKTYRFTVKVDGYVL